MSFDSSSFQKPISGNFTALNNSVDITSPNQSAEIIQITGTFVATLVVEGSNDGINFQSILTINTANSLQVSTITAPGMFLTSPNGYQFARIRCSAFTSGAATATVYGSDATSLINAFSILKGATDGTSIGNTGDRLKVSNGLREGGVHGALTLTTAGTSYEAKVGANRLSGRRCLTITPNNNMFWGYSSSVTAANGTPAYKDQPLVFDIDQDSTFQVWLVSATPAATARITESP